MINGEQFKNAPAEVDPREFRFRRIAGNVGGRLVRPFDNEQQEMVAEFHDAMELPVGETIGFRMADLRAALIFEEALETIAAMGFEIEYITPDGKSVEIQAGDLTLVPAREPDMVETIDGLCDLKYVIDGAAATFGIDLAPFFREVHRSNMNKVGGERRPDGKRLKPAGWEPPQIAAMLDELMQQEKDRDDNDRRPAAPDPE